VELNDDLISALQQGDEQVFEKIFKHYYQRLCSYANSILNDMDEAEECVQQMFLNLWEKKSAVTVTVSLKSYLYRAVHNAALNRIKHGKVRQLYADEYVRNTSEVTEHTNLPFEKNELQVQISKAISQLPEQCRMVFKLSRFENMKYQEIADHLGISIKTVENHMGKALKIMREQLRDYLPVIIAIMSWIFCN
jgi:RNA polymerase sigma-70 factor (family 1)